MKPKASRDSLEDYIDLIRSRGGGGVMKTHSFTITDEQARWLEGFGKVMLMSRSEALRLVIDFARRNAHYGSADFKEGE